MWVGGSVVHPLVGGEGGASKNCERWDACAATPKHLRKLFLLGESGTVVPLLTSATSAPWHPSHASTSSGFEEAGGDPWCARVQQQGVTFTSLRRPKSRTHKGITYPGGHMSHAHGGTSFRRARGPKQLTGLNRTWFSADKRPAG